MVIGSPTTGKKDNNKTGQPKILFFDTDFETLMKIPAFYEQEFPNYNQENNSRYKRYNFQMKPKQLPHK